MPGAQEGLNAFVVRVGEGKRENGERKQKTLS